MIAETEHELKHRLLALYLVLIMCKPYKIVCVDSSKKCGKTIWVSTGSSSRTSAVRVTHGDMSSYPP